MALSGSHTARSRANPSASRDAARLRTSRPRRASPLPASHVNEGRTRSEVIATGRASKRQSRRHGPWPRLSTQVCTTCRQARPEASAPLERHRSCQVPPGWSSSQSRSRIIPRRRFVRLSARVPTSDITLSPSKISRRVRRVASHESSVGRGGKATWADRSWVVCSYGVAAGVSTSRLIGTTAEQDLESLGPIARGRDWYHPFGGESGLLDVVGKHPADHVLSARRQVDLRRGQ